MRLRLLRFFYLASLMLSLQFLNLGCSSSDSSEEDQGEEVEASDEESANNAEESADNEANEENANANANAEGAESNGLNAEAGGNQNNQLAENNVLNDTGNVLADNQGQAGEEDLQQIIEEMNTTTNGTTANAAGTQGILDNGGNVAIANAGSQTSAVPTNTAGAPAVSGAPAGAGLPELGSKMAYIVQKGDTLAKIAARIYGDANKWTEIANFTGLANPRLIYPGDVVYYQLTEQSMTFASSYDNVKRSEVTIQEGDTLATIAGRVLGNSSLWKLIWRQNDLIDNPDRLTAGTSLFYVDPASMASLDRELGRALVKSNDVEPHTVKVMTASKGKSGKKPVFEVANDSLNDLFSQHGTQDLLKRT